MRDNRPLVSVIIPARDCGLYIEAAIQSVLNQTHPSIEVIIVDDQSVDNTAAVAGSVADDRVRVITGNGFGASAARNLGLEASHGDFVMFLDADDLITPRKIESQLDLLRGSQRLVAACAWAHFESDHSSAVPRPEPCWRESDPIRWLQCSLNGGGMMQTGCWLAHRSVLSAAGPWNESLSLHDDGEYFCRVLLRASKICFAENELVYYRRVTGSLSRQRSRKSSLSALTVCRLRDEWLLSADASELSRQAIATQYANWLYEFGKTMPEESAHVYQRLKLLAIEPSLTVGGPAFRLLTALIGFQRANRFRELLK